LGVIKFSQLYPAKEKKTSNFSGLIFISIRPAQIGSFVRNWWDNLAQGTEKHQFKISEVHIWPEYYPGSLVCFSKAQAELKYPVNTCKNK